MRVRARARVCVCLCVCACVRVSESVCVCVYVTACDYIDVYSPIHYSPARAGLVIKREGSAQVQGKVPRVTRGYEIVSTVGTDIRCDQEGGNSHLEENSLCSCG